MYTFERTIEKHDLENLENNTSYCCVTPKVSISFPELKEYDPTINDLLIMFKSFLLALGYSYDSIETIQRQNE